MTDRMHAHECLDNEKTEAKQCHLSVTVAVPSQYRRVSLFQLDYHGALKLTSLPKFRTESQVFSSYVAFEAANVPTANYPTAGRRPNVPFGRLIALPPLHLQS